jgi:hypothetical protein
MRTPGMGTKADKLFSGKEKGVANVVDLIVTAVKTI